MKKIIDVVEFRPKAIVDPVRYSDEKLEIFRQPILAKQKKVLFDISVIVNNDRNSNGTDDTGTKHQVEEDGLRTLSSEENQKYYDNLWKVKSICKRALMRIENKTYGVCEITGKLIPEERLRGNPFAVSCIEAKLAEKKMIQDARTVNVCHLLKMKT